jgi:iron complex transport system ATP-binding protein
MAAGLSFYEVEFAYQSTSDAVFDRFSLEIAAGRVTALLGPNGTGKTTLLHLALGWLQPQRGQVMIDGRPLRELSRREVGQTIGVVQQGEASSFDFSILDFVCLGRAPYLPLLGMPGPQDVALARDAIQQTGLASLATRSMRTLSGGERQMAMLARVLAQQPRLLLLDEPTTHLDLKNKAKLAQIIDMLVQRGTTIVFSTHEPDFVAALAEDVVLIKRGAVKQTGPIDAVFTSENLSHIFDLPVEVAVSAGRHSVHWFPGSVRRHHRSS